MAATAVMAGVKMRTVKGAPTNPLRAARTAIEIQNGATDMDLKTVTWALALSTTLLYLLCIAYGLANPAAGHMRDFLTITLPGFEWLTPKGFAIGLVKSFLYGALVGLVYVPIYNTLQRRFGS
jgi:hypothetical protein